MAWNTWLCWCVQQKPTAADAEDACTRSVTNRVELAASELFSVPGLATAYHTSVLVNGEEFFFSDSGIFSDRALTSHQGHPTELVELGYSSRTGAELLNALQPHFAPGSYDLIRKNCNSFSDCAVYFLLGKRLERRYSALENYGMRASIDLLHRFTDGRYCPNETAASFSTKAVLATLDKLGDGDPPVQSASMPALCIGARVTIVGLRRADALNGQGAAIKRYNAVSGRWEARLYFSGETKAFRAENLRPAGELVLETGDIARIHGLASEAGRELNGREGEVLRYMYEISRYEVRVGLDTKALKAENLEALNLGCDSNALRWGELGAL